MNLQGWRFAAEGANLAASKILLSFPSSIAPSKENIYGGVYETLYATRQRLKNILGEFIRKGEIERKVYKAPLLIKEAREWSKEDYELVSRLSQVKVCKNRDGISMWVSCVALLVAIDTLIDFQKQKSVNR